MKVGIVQMEMSLSRTDNLEKALGLSKQACEGGAQVILLPELFMGPYFCSEQNPTYFELAREVEKSEAVNAFTAFSKEHNTVCVVSFFEREHAHYYNSVAVVESGKVLGVYRKSHIPDGPGYMEKFYFRPGDTGFKSWKTRFGTIGVGICWDQWFPECARSLVLQGAEILLYPTAIGSEPEEPGTDTSRRWQRAMQGHAVSNVVPVCAANRIGDEGVVRFYGHSFAADETGELCTDMAGQEGVCVVEFDLQTIRQERANWGFFRDRRQDLYSNLSGT